MDLNPREASIILGGAGCNMFRNIMMQTAMLALSGGALSSATPRIPNKQVAMSPYKKGKKRGNKRKIGSNK